MGSYRPATGEGILLEQIYDCARQRPVSQKYLAQVENLRDFVVPTALPGIKVNTSDTENMIWTQMRLQRWTGTSRKAFRVAVDAVSE